MQDKTLLNFFLKKNEKIRYFTTFACFWNAKAFNKNLSLSKKKLLLI
jgi:hypothetical protein